MTYGVCDKCGKPATYMKRGPAEYVKNVGDLQIVERWCDADVSPELKAAFGKKLNEASDEP